MRQNLLDDIADGQSQTDATFKTNRLYTRLTAVEVREQLIKQKGYSDDELPTEETIRVKLNQLDYELGNVQKSRPKKKIPETDAIFETLDELHTTAKEDKTAFRIAWDAKATILSVILEGLFFWDPTLPGSINARRSP